MTHRAATSLDRETGWQNVLREIQRQLGMREQKPGEPPLHPVEQSEHDGWQVAHDAVLTRLDDMADGSNGRAD